MTLPKSQVKYFRKELVKEIRRVVKFIQGEDNIEKKLYYFSASHGITGRTIRYTFSSDILLADLVLNQVYRILLERINRIKIGDPTVNPQDDIFDKLCTGLSLLADRFESEENIQEPLEILLTTAFSTSGPGNYLLEKGDLNY